jgi:hypothetical protein
MTSFLRHGLVSPWRRFRHRPDVWFASRPLRRHHGIRFPRRIHQGGGGQPHVHDPAIFGDPLQAVGLQNLSPGKLLDHRQRFLALALRDQIADVHRQRLGFAPAVHPFRPGIPGQDAALQVLHQDGIVARHGPPRPATQGLGFPQRRLRFFISVISVKVITAPSITFSWVR